MKGGASNEDFAELVFLGAGVPVLDDGISKSNVVSGCEWMKGNLR